MRIRRSAPVALLVLAAAAPVRAQQPDTTRLYHLDALVVTAERRAAPIEASTHALSLLTAAELRALPVRTLAEALRQAPGLTFVDFDGLGDDPQIMTRGFYGGGEAEYVLVLVDGRPLNVLESGRVPWDVIPLDAIESIEVARGPGSAAWGDAAIGGVINVLTKRGGAPSGRVALLGGEHGVARASLGLADRVAGRPFSLFGSYARTDGFRDHGERRTGAVGASLDLIEPGDRALTLTTLHDWRRHDEPGPLTAQSLSSSRTVSSPFYRFDGADERQHRLALDGRRALGTGTIASASLAAEYRHHERVRTVPLAPTFADTKERVLSTARLAASAQLQRDGIAFAGRDQLVIGVDASAGTIDSEYYAFRTGTLADYAAGPGVRGDLDASGDGRRTAAAGFLGYEVRAAEAVRLTLGGRLDWLRDTFDDDAAAAAERDASHVAFSPRAGLNVRYLDGERQRGHAYVNVARTFKAPTPDQLFDQRTFPVPFPPFAVGFANDSLEPQFGTSWEGGLYHRAELAPGTLAAEVTLSAYHMDVRDELDFDLATLSYQNIGRSRHRGIEAGVDVRGSGPLGGFARYTLQSATTRVGEHSGNQLKAIPRHFLSAGVDAGSAVGLSGAVVVSSARSTWLDDANTVELPAWTRWDARLAYELRGFTLQLEAFNLFDAEYSTTGFPDSADPSVIYYHPAAGRTLQIGLSRGW